MQQTRNRKEKGKEEKKRKLKKERGTNRKERDRENKMIQNDIQNDNNWIIWTGHKIGAEGARMISEALKTNTTLTKLDLHCDENEVKWKQPNK